MIEIIEVKFRNNGRTYSFNPKGFTFKPGDNVIVDTARGIEYGEVVTGNFMVNDDQVVSPLKDVIRLATKEDTSKINENIKKEMAAFSFCEEKIAFHKLDMKLVNVEFSFDRSKLLFYFTADERVDFRELVKDLAATFHTRIELRQIGVRDEAKMLGGIGICGQPFCCTRFLDDFQPVSIKMAKEQGLSLNPVKISGCCGRLMCCLKYEQNAYEHLIKTTPKIGSVIEAKDGVGTVADVNLLTGMLKVRFGEDDAVTVSIHKDDVKVVKSSNNKVSSETENVFEGTEE